MGSRYAGLLLAVAGVVAGCGSESADHDRRVGSDDSIRTMVVGWQPFAGGPSGRAWTLISLLAARATTCRGCRERIGAARGMRLPTRAGASVTLPARRFVCAADPWDRSLVEISVDREVRDLATGSPAARRRDPTWGIELRSGDRCVLATGAHDVLPPSLGGLVVDYICRSGGIVLLRNLRRGRVWRIGVARYRRGITSGSVTQPSATQHSELRNPLSGSGARVMVGDSLTR